MQKINYLKHIEALKMKFSQIDLINFGYLIRYF